MSILPVRFLALLALVLLAACSTRPDTPPPEVVRLNNQLAQLQADERVASNAPDELRTAQRAVTSLANQAYDLDEDVFQHRVYIADRLLQTAEALGLARYQEQRGEELGRTRDQLLLAASTSQAQAAREAAEIARAQAVAERRAAEMAREEVVAARAELEAMRSKLSELQTRKTDRGLVVTLGDVLFEVDKAALKPGAERSLNQLVDALREAPDTRIRIEGHTDSTGSHGYNMELSRERAESVRDYLVTHGVDPSKVSTRGLGPDYPVASNDTAAGRQQNRRVEVILSDPENTSNNGY